MDKQFEIFTSNGVEYSVTVNRDMIVNDYYNVNFKVETFEDFLNVLETVKKRYNGADIFGLGFTKNVCSSIQFTLKKRW